MNVTELARQLNTTREELLASLPKLGFDIGHRAIKIDNASAERIKRAWTEAARRARLREKLEKAEEKVHEREADAGKRLTISVPNKITVNDLAAKLNIQVVHLIGYLMKNGIMATLNEQIDFETASIVAADYGFTAVRAGTEDVTRDQEAHTSLKDLKRELASSKNGLPRPPVVVVMGHVDHGKTTLLDTIRKTNVAGGESGGITQHIGAYQVEEAGKKITFLDTPGHEAFKAMRERGGQVADIAILVVAADDGLKPQTLESINVIQKEGIPFVVAINKIDKPGADIDRVKKELADINLASEDWGGKTIITPVSAKAGTNIHELLETVLLVADMEQFTAPSDRAASGVIIESHVDPGEGPVATVLVNAGVLKVGDGIVIGKTYGKIKALKNWLGENISEAAPSTPVKILGLKSAPHVGDILRVERLGRAHRKQAVKQYRFVEVSSGHESMTEEDKDHAKAKSTFAAIVKADVLGSLEALIVSMKKLENESVHLDIIKQGLGNITESDLTLAESSGATVYGFNVQMSQEAQKLSYRRTVDIKLSKIIYEILDDAKERMKKFVKTETVEVPQGELKVLKVFKDSRAESIIGGRVCKAKITKEAKFRVMREGEPIDEGSIVELQQNKEPITEAKEGIECGAKVTGVRGIKEGDMLACYVEEERVIGGV